MMSTLFRETRVQTPRWSFLRINACRIERSQGGQHVTLTLRTICGYSCHINIITHPRTSNIVDVNTRIYYGTCGPKLDGAGRKCSKASYSWGGNAEAEPTRLVDVYRM